MVNEIIADAEQRMQKSVTSLEDALKKIRTGRAHPSILDSIMVSYYGTDTSLTQLANVNVEEGRSLLISPWEKAMIGDIEKAILKSDLGLNPANNGDTIRVPMPVLTEETRKEFTKQAKHEAENARLQAKHEAENARVAIRNIRRDANSDFKELGKEKEIGEDEQHRAEERVQKLTDKYIAVVESTYHTKEADLLSF